MTQEEHCSRFDDTLQGCDNESDEDEVIVRKDRASVREMILRFETTNFGDCSDSLERSKDPMLGSLTNVVNPIHSHYHHLFPVTRSQDRISNVSVNSILSNASENSSESSSSGFVSDRKSGLEMLAPHRRAPPPPEPFNDGYSSRSKSPPSEEVVFRERRYSMTTPSSSPVATRRSRQPPVIRRKSTVSNQGHLGETHWSYGVKQSDLERLLRLKRSETSDNEDEAKIRSVEVSEDETKSNSRSSTSSSSDSNSDNNIYGKEYIVNVDDGRTDTLSTDHSTDTLINEGDSDNEDDSSIVSGVSGDRSNFDNVSIKSISSLDMVPYQKYDSITVSSDEFGSEVCHAPDTEFLTVSAVNEWCISKSIEPVLMPVESKKEKYRR